MAEEKPSGGIPETLVFLVLLLVGLGVLSYLRTGSVVNPKGNGIFINPPSPLGNGAVYGPQIYIGTSSPPSTN